MRNTTGPKGGARVPRRSGMAELFVVPKLEEVAAQDGVADALDAHTTELLETTAIEVLMFPAPRRLGRPLRTRLA